MHNSYISILFYVVQITKGITRKLRVEYQIHSSLIGLYWRLKKYYACNIASLFDIVCVPFSDLIQTILPLNSGNQNFNPSQWHHYTDINMIYSRPEYSWNAVHVIDYLF